MRLPVQPRVSTVSAADPRAHAGARPSSSQRGAWGRA